MAKFIGTDDLRLIDANANRAREGIRTAEDYVRFKAGDGRWAKRLKDIRHSLTQCLATHFGNRELVTSRNVGADPLTPEGDSESGKEPPAAESSLAIAQRGLKRAQEAMRVIEEYLRSESADASLRFAKGRFELYKAEQWLVCSSSAAGVVASASVYVVLTKELCSKGLMATAEATLKGGAKLLQVRDKAPTSDKALLAEARDLHRLCASYGAVLICNDRADVALAAKAGGLHLGQEDLSPLDVRRLAGEKLIVGRSTHSVEQARSAVQVEQADYIAIGAMYDTSTKRQRTLAGVGLAERVCALGLSVPVFAIGGITVERARELKKVGIKQVAVSSAIVADPDPEAATRRLVDVMVS
ncbi:MAG: thiamine phosphate synthase [Planctomycetota bacterium]|nr:thiamine phosphate synthase [Planctomycetota bacterium]